MRIKEAVQINIDYIPQTNNMGKYLSIKSENHKGNESVVAHHNVYRISHIATFAFTFDLFDVFVGFIICPRLPFFEIKRCMFLILRLCDAKCKSV